MWEIHEQLQSGRHIHLSHFSLFALESKYYILKGNQKDDEDHPVAQMK